MGIGHGAYSYKIRLDADFNFANTMRFELCRTSNQWQDISDQYFFA